MLRIVILGNDPWNCRFRYDQTSSQKCSLPKTCPEYSGAFQTNAKRLFGFFNAPQLLKASFRRFVALKKPLICMRGFVANIGASLDEFAEDVRAILTPNLKKLHLLQIIQIS